MKVKLYRMFEHWYNGGTIWIISDTHFEDPDCKLMDLNWVSPEEQIKIINSKVGKKDTLIHLGDVGNKEWVKKLKGYKVLITGNHDSGPTTYEDVFDEVYGGPIFINEKILLSHEPIGMNLGFGLNIHGHVHNESLVYKVTDETYNYETVNLAANVCGYIPQRLDKLYEGSKVKTIHRAYLDDKEKCKELLEKVRIKVEEDGK